MKEKMDLPVPKDAEHHWNVNLILFKDGPYFKGTVALVKWNWKFHFLHNFLTMHIFNQTMYHCYRHDHTQDAFSNFIIYWMETMENLTQFEMQVSCACALPIDAQYLQGTRTEWAYLWCDLICCVIISLLLCVLRSWQAVWLDLCQHQFVTLGLDKWFD